MVIAADVARQPPHGSAASYIHPFTFIGVSSLVGSGPSPWVEDCQPQSLLGTFSLAFFVAKTLISLGATGIRYLRGQLKNSLAL
jgi:hypothetical protein